MNTMASSEYTWVRYNPLKSLIMKVDWFLFGSPMNSCARTSPLYEGEVVTKPTSEYQWKQPSSRNCWMAHCEDRAVWNMPKWKHDLVQFTLDTGFLLFSWSIRDIGNIEIGKALPLWGSVQWKSSWVKVMDGVKEGSWVSRKHIILFFFFTHKCSV